MFAVITSVLALMAGLAYVIYYGSVFDRRERVARNAIGLGLAWVGSAFAGLALHTGWDGHGWIGSIAYLIGAGVLVHRCWIIFDERRKWDAEHPASPPEAVEDITN